MCFKNFINLFNFNLKKSTTLFGCIIKTTLFLFFINKSYEIFSKHFEPIMLLYNFLVVLLGSFGIFQNRFKKIINLLDFLIIISSFIMLYTKKKTNLHFVIINYNFIFARYISLFGYILEKVLKIFRRLDN